MQRVLSIAMLLLVLTAGAAAIRARSSAAAGEDQRPERLLKAMQDLAGRTTVRRKDVPDAVPASLVAAPVFRCPTRSRRGRSSSSRELSKSD